MGIWTHGYLDTWIFVHMDICTPGYLYTCKANPSERSMMVEDSSKRNEERKALDEGGVMEMLGFNEFVVCTNTGDTVRKSAGEASDGSRWINNGCWYLGSGCGQLSGR